MSVLRLELCKLAEPKRDSIATISLLQRTELQINEELKRLAQKSPRTSTEVPLE